MIWNSRGSYRSGDNVHGAVITDDCYGDISIWLNYTGDPDTDTLVSVEDIENALCQAAGVDCIVSERILNSYPSLIIHLKLLLHFKIFTCSFTCLRT